MGLKLKWFRRRITFEGIPSAPERSIRRKEQTSGVTVIGVYRHSVNFEDYIEPSRASYGEPPSQPFVTTTIRKPSKSTSSSTTANKSTDKNNVEDKITPEENNGRAIEIPAEPSYSPPKPPTRRAISKTKSTPNISTLEKTAKADTLKLPPLEATRSVEVLNEVITQETVTPVATTPQAARINYNAEHDNENVGESVQKEDFKQIEHWKQQQPEFFNEILEKVNGFAKTETQFENPTTTDDNHDSKEETNEDIFEKVRSKPRIPLEESESTVANSNDRDFSRHTSSSSIEDIFEPRPPEYIFAISMEEPQDDDSAFVQSEPVQAIPEPAPRKAVETITEPDVIAPASKPLKSILKKHAPAPPTAQLSSPTEVSTAPAEIPTPPPRANRTQPDPAPKQSSPTDEDDYDYLNWDMIERHRSSINHTMAAQLVDPEILRNVPASLQQNKPLLNTRAILDEEQPKTLRGMRNRQTNGANGSQFLGLQGRTARDSDPNYSEASA